MRFTLLIRLSGPDWHASANKSQMLEIFKTFHPNLLKVLKYVALPPPTLLRVLTTEQQSNRSQILAPPVPRPGFNLDKR